MALLSVAEALEHVTRGLTPLETERVALDRGRGRVLAEDLAARLTQPPFDASAMDGYAVRAADVAALPLSEVTVEFEPTRDPAGLRVTATANVDAKTGVEMEALVAVSVACLTIYDMCKGVDRAMSFSGIRLMEKTGGRSGTFRR